MSDETIVDVVSLFKPYAEQVKSAVNKRNAAVTRFKGGMWGIIRTAALESRKQELSVDQFHAGMLAACKAEKVPEGTVKSYLNAARHLLNDLEKGQTPDGEAFTESDAEKVAIAAVRKAHPKEKEDMAEPAKEKPATQVDLYRDAIFKIVRTLGEDDLRAVLESLNATYGKHEEAPVEAPQVAEAA